MNKLIDERILSSTEISKLLQISKGISLKNDEKVLRKAQEIYEIISINNPERLKDKPLMMSSCLYMSAVLLGEKVTQSDIAKLFNISISTFNKKYKDIAKLYFGPAVGECCK